MAREHTQAETKRRNPKAVDQFAVASVANLQIAALNVRNQIERNVLDKHKLTWSGFVTLWVIWIWETPDAGQVSAETGLAKATLSGVLKTLETNKLITRKANKEDARSTLLALTAKGRKLIETVFPEFNAEATKITAHVGKENQRDLVNLLSSLV